MAKSPSHQFGQYLGNLLERAIEPELRSFAAKHNLYLDCFGPRKGARKGKKVSWFDLDGNKHDLDFVLERDGSEGATGHPVAFVECAWRRYEKHSKNKAQEIQGALIPLMDTFPDDPPFLVALLAGRFTGTSLKQLSSLGFEVLYIPDAVQDAFRQHGIDIEFGEKTTAIWFEDKLAEIIAGGPELEAAVIADISRRHRGDLDHMLAGLERHVTRTVATIGIETVYRVSAEMSDGKTISRTFDDLKSAQEWSAERDSNPYLPSS